MRQNNKIECIFDSIKNKSALGANIRTARLRRNLSIAEVAAKIGVDRHVIGDAERGKPTTSIAIYAGILWAMGLVGPLGRLASPESDEQGTLLAMAHGRLKAGAGKALEHFSIKWNPVNRKKFDKTST
jgi:transcriptional regulator with XRE-family HTH domain